jgi:hypothetical protein
MAFALILGVTFAVRIVLAESVIRSVLTQQGLAGVKLRVTELSAHRLQIEGLRIGTELSLDTVTVGYHLPRLMLKQIDTVTLSGLKLDIPDMHSGLMATIRRRMQEKPPSSKQPSAAVLAFNKSFHKTLLPTQ